MEPTDAACGGCSTTVLDRLEHLGIDACALAYAARRLCRHVWAEPEVLTGLAATARRLALAPDAVLELQESASRSGALWALSLLKSWYPGADLELLKAGFRDDDSYDELKKRPDLRDAACTIADFVDLAEFIPDRTQAQDSEAEYAEGDGTEEPAKDSKGKAVEKTGCSKTGDVASSSKAAE